MDLEHGNESVLDLIEERDLDVRLSCAFLLSCSFKNFLEIRELIKNHLSETYGERLFHNTASSVKLYLIKEDDYDLLQEAKQERKEQRRY